MLKIIAIITIFSAISGMIESVQPVRRIASIYQNITKNYKEFKMKHEHKKEEHKKEAHHKEPGEHVVHKKMHSHHHEMKKHHERELKHHEKMMAHHHKHSKKK